MTKFVFAIATALSLSTGSAQLHAQNTTYDPAPVITGVFDELSDIRKLLNELAAAPDGGWFLRSQEDVQSDLDHLLDDVISLIVQNDYQNAREAIFGFDRNLTETAQAMDELRVSLLTAQSSETLKNTLDTVLLRDFARGSREDIEQRIAQLEVESSELKRKKTEMEQGFRRLLQRRYEISLSEDEVRSVLYQINGRSIVEASITFSVLQKVEQRLGQIRNAVTDDQSLRRYYGVAAIMRLISVRLHERHLIDYRQEWLPALGKFEAENDELIEQTLDLISSSSSNRLAERLQRNLDIQVQISEVVDDYRDLLLTRENLVEERLQVAIEEAQLAINTLRTLDQAVVLFEQFSRQQEEFDALMSIESSDLIPLDDAEVFENFLTISRGLEGS